VVHAELVNAGCADDEIHQITWQNSCRFFGWDPFMHIGRNDATVGVLRATASDVDTTVRSREDWKTLFETTVRS
jgi:hypothetical protein